MSSKDSFSKLVQALTRLNAYLKPFSSTSMKSVLVGLYWFNHQEAVFQYIGFIGLLSLDYDRKLNTKFIRLYELETLKIVFEVQLYNNFIQNYKRFQQSTLYYFEYPNDQNIQRIGLLFRNQQEAEIMYIKLKSQSPRQQKNKQIKDQQQLYKLKIKIYQQKLRQHKLNLNQILQAQKQQNLIRSKKQDNNKITHQKKLNSTQCHSMNQFKQLSHSIQNFTQNTQLKIIKMVSNPQNIPIQSKTKEVPIFTVKENQKLMQQIRNNKIKLKHVTTIQKGGLNNSYSDRNTNDNNEFTTALKKKILMRRNALNKHQEQYDN